MSDIVKLVNGKLKFPRVELAPFHAYAKSARCSTCDKRFRDCLCVKPGLANLAWGDWNYKGTMVLPVTHPDHPDFHSNQNKRTNEDKR